MTQTAVVVMAYGTPRGLDEVESYYTDIRHGRPPPPDLLEELTARYRAIGGRSPLLAITTAQAEGIAARLEGIPVYIGQKHAAPRIPAAVARMKADRIERAVGLVLAPHFSSMSVGDYERRVLEAKETAGWTGTFEIIPSWHLEPGYLSFLCAAVETARKQLPREVGEDSVVLFTAHSLPARILEAGDPYARQLHETAEAVASRVHIGSWETAWQSAGRTADPWIGPDLLEVLPRLKDKGVPAVIVCPCGFVADHLEVLYDVDIEARGVAQKLGIAFARTRSPNDDPGFLDTLAGIVKRALGR